MLPFFPAILLTSEIPTTAANPWNFAELRRENFMTTHPAEDRQILRAWVEASDFTEAIPSWNADLPSGTGITISLQPEGAPKPFLLATWQSGAQSSFKSQKSAFGRVDTDTLVLTKSAKRILVTLTLQGKDGRFPMIKSFYTVFTPARVGASSLPKAGQIPTIEVPKRAQMNYEGGSVLCSPTSVSMVLSYWSAILDQPDLDRDVPEVKQCVFDPVYNGAGNWSFNASFGGSLPGMKGYVTRLRTVEDVERWVTAGVPVITSVNYGLLQGKPQESGGHLVVVVGFDAEGNPIFNDPGRGVVRMNYKRKDFQRGWAASGNTVYLLYPRGWNIPQSGPWADLEKN